MQGLSLMSLIVMCGCPNQKRTFGCGGRGGEGGVGGQTNKVEGGCVEACACGGFAPKLGKVRASTSLNFQTQSTAGFNLPQRIFPNKIFWHIFGRDVEEGLCSG